MRDIPRETIGNLRRLATLAPVNEIHSQTAPPPATVTLLSAPLGRKLRLVTVEGQPKQCQRLREMGFCASAEIVKVSQGLALICQVCGVRMAVSRDLAQSIRVNHS